MSVTIKDVAKAAGVSPSTVSRVISDNPNISDKTKRKVRKVMDELGYHLNYSARNLAQQSTKTIGVVVKHSVQKSMHNSFFPEVVAGISALCSKYDFSISLTTGETEAECFDDVVKMVRGKRVDGMIVLYSKENDPVVPYLTDSGIPFVMIGKPTEQVNKITYIDNDNVQAAEEATNYLLELGHEKIGFIGEGTEFEVGKARLNGYMQALKNKDIPIEERYMYDVRFEMAEGRKVVESLLEIQERPTALITINDFNALIMLTALQEKGISVPQDMSLISFNNSTISKMTNPTLTTVDTQIFQLGYESANSLIELINESTTFVKRIIIPTMIVEGASCQSIIKKN